MPRNLNERVEVLFPIEAEHLIRYIKDVILDMYMKDNCKARLMQPDGSYIRVSAPGQPDVNVQESLIKGVRNLTF